VSVVDAVVVLIALVAAARGAARGLLGQVFEFGGGLVGLAAGAVLAPRVASLVTQGPGLAGALVALIFVLAGLSLGQVVGFTLGQRSGALARRARLGGVDALLGSVFGVVVTLVAFWLIGSLLVQGPSLDIARAVSRSRLLHAMNEVAEPPDVLASLTKYLDRSGFPSVYALGDVPRATGPIRLPSSKVARAAVTEAAPSTVRVTVDACGGRQLGSGWIAAPSTVVTNAHVVAGGGPVTVEERAGTHRASVVVFDPDEDVAVLHVPGLRGRPLPLDQRSRDRGAGGATLGYPGASDGVLRAHRAAVKRRINPTGYDIYGRHTVTREVYELNARVRQGDSGGPFVLSGGRVAGVVFAASTIDPNTGYALTAAQVADEIETGRRSARSVSTGRCTH
jgi:S1-C subfamily serine protease